MSYEDILYEERDDGVARITINRRGRREGVLHRRRPDGP
jgi:1,4-dihydroxy-2-naphthoyl-CoA synthase